MSKKCLSTDLEHLQSNYKNYLDVFKNITQSCISTRDIVALLLKDDDMDIATVIKLVSSIADLNKTAVTSLKENIILEEKFNKIASALDNANPHQEEIIDVKQLFE